MTKSVSEEAPPTIPLTLPPEAHALFMRRLAAATNASPSISLTLSAQASPIALTLSTPEAAALLGVSRQTFWRWQAAGITPKPAIKQGRCVRWARVDIEALASGALVPREVAA